MTAPDLDLYRALVENAPTMVWRARADATRDYVNATWLAFTGCSIQEELGTGWLDRVHPDDVERCRAQYLRPPQLAFEIEFRLRRHDGVYRYVLDRAAPYTTADGSFAGFIGACTDIDDRRRSSMSEAVELFEMSLDNLCIAGFDGYLKRVNPAWTRTLGWTADELTSRPSIEFVHPDDRDHVHAARRRLANGAPLLGLVNRYRHKDGSYRWLEWRSVAHVDRGVVYAAARDVTEQIEDQRARRELTESLTTTLNSIADGVIATDSAGAVARMNPVAEKLTGWTAADAMGRPLGDVFHAIDAETRAPPEVPPERTLGMGIAAEASKHTLLVGRDGAEVPIASSCAPMRNPDGSVSGAVLVFRDMTADKNARKAHEQLQRQLILSDRLASIGTLAAGVAHEINNPLAYVLGNLDMLLDEMRSSRTTPEEALMAEWVDMARDARDGSERIHRIVRGLTTLARGNEDPRAVIDVMPVLELSVQMAHNEIRHRARLVKTFHPIPFVAADDARLGQVFLNLLVNAAQAIVEGSTEANEIRVLTMTDAEGRAVIEVSDTGPGIPDAVIGRVFDPFFTTKPIGVGTGLGLWVCHNIVTSMGGTITARNQRGRGATFRVVLPAATGRLEGAPPARVEMPAVGRRASILVVDDDPVVGTTLGRVLREHSVTVVTTASEALDLLVAGAPFDIILSDLMMPGMSGIDLYDELTRAVPQVTERIVFVTGGAFTTAASEFLARVPNQRIEKPFDPTFVRRLVETLVA